jgi:hypothetical protein
MMTFWSDEIDELESILQPGKMRTPSDDAVDGERWVRRYRRELEQAGARWCRPTEPDRTR